MIGRRVSARRLPVGEELVERDQVGVAHVGEEAELLLEPVERVGVETLERLERDLLLPLLFARYALQLYADLKEDLVSFVRALSIALRG